MLARDLRAAGAAVLIEFDDRKMKKAMTRAADSGAHYALIVGDSEVASSRYGLKNLATGEQESLTFEEIAVKLAAAM
jgi:histidyl-tRNA synthetase